MPHITANGLELFYDENGDRDKETILLVMGLGAQMTLWPDEFVEALVGEGYHVVRYDNRDIGLSEKFEGAKAPGIKMQMLRKVIRWPAKVPYSLSDMADDGAALLGALGIEKAHVVGASMGGMIAQLMAVNHGDKLHSLTSIMSSTGNMRLPQADKVAMDALTAPIPSMEEEALIQHGDRLLVTRASPEVYSAVRRAVPDAAGRLMSARIPVLRCGAESPTCSCRSESRPVSKPPLASGGYTCRRCPCGLVTKPSRSGPKAPARP